KSYFLFLSYALPLINNLNKEFQSEKSRLPYLYSSMKSYFLFILNNFIAKNKVLHVNINYKSTCNHIELPKIFIGTKAEVLLKKRQQLMKKLSNHNLNCNLDIDLFWEKVSSMKDGPDLSGFVFNLLSLPHSSAVAERKFSSLKLIKTSIRNKLEVSILHAIMICKELTNRNIVWSAKKKEFP
ncbi:uncharacterized protein LOC115065906, partial [Bactrocera dorsalis]|uniref:Uncharacterized protein LOC115065906 n=1 Tax=Bactrocera dorsalis TaxID=27457 RepID=A0A8N4L209_BACDO